jgi:hypothetical protein
MGHASPSMLSQGVGSNDQTPLILQCNLPCFAPLSITEDVKDSIASLQDLPNAIRFMHLRFI